MMRFCCRRNNLYRQTIEGKRGVRKRNTDRGERLREKESRSKEGDRSITETPSKYKESHSHSDTQTHKQSTVTSEHLLMSVVVHVFLCVSLCVRLCSSMTQRRLRGFRTAFRKIGALVGWEITFQTKVSNDKIKTISFSNFVICCILRVCGYYICYCCFFLFFCCFFIVILQNCHSSRTFNDQLFFICYRIYITCNTVIFINKSLFSICSTKSKKKSKCLSVEKLLMDGKRFLFCSDNEKLLCLRKMSINH